MLKVRKMHYQIGIFTCPERRYTHPDEWTVDFPSVNATIFPNLNKFTSECVKVFIRCF